MRDDERIAVTAEPGRGRLALRGRVTVAAAAEFLAAARELAAGTADVTVDLSAAEHLDVAAVQVLLALGREVRAGGRRCDVIGVGPGVAETFRLVGVAG